MQNSQGSQVNNQEDLHWVANKHSKHRPAEVFDPSGGRGSFIQGTSTQRGSVMIDPAEIEKLRRDLQDVVLENDKLKMDLSQQEKEKDLAKKRQSEAEADTAAQIEKVKYLEKVMAEQQAKLRQAPRPSTVGGSRFVSIDDLNNAQDKLHDSEKELAHIRNELIDLKGEYARIMREKEQADGRAREAQQAADQSAKEAKYFKEKSETLQQELYAEQPGQPGQPGQQPRGSTLGGKQTFETQTSRVFDPSGGRGSFIQGTSTQRGSVMIDPAEIEKLRRDLQDVVLENDKLKMDLSQQEKEKDLAKKRQSEAEADTAAQIEKVKYLEKVMAEQQAKLRQAPRPSTVGGSRFVSIDDLNNAQDKLHDSEKELAHIRNELIDLKGEYARIMREKEQADGRAREAQQAADQSAKEAKYFKEKSETLQQELYAEQPGTQPGQQPRGSTLGGKQTFETQTSRVFDPSGGRGSFIQGTSTQRGSVMIDPAEIEKLRRDLQDVVLENDKLKMDLSQQEKEKDLAKKRQSEAEADTAAQIEKVKYLEKVMAEQQAKLRQAPRPSTVGGSRFVSIDDLNNAQDKLHDSEKELAHIRNELIDLKGEYARVMREKEQADGRAREAQQAADQSAKEAKYFKEKSETLQQELYAEQPGQPGQPGQQPRGSTLGGKQTFETQTSRVFDPSGGRGSFIQGTSTQRGSVMIDPAEIEKLRRDLQDVVLENDKLKMDLSQQEKEKDLAKKRQSEAEADTAAQIEKVKYLEKVMAEQQAKLRQAPRPSTVGGSRFVSIDDLNNAQDKLHDSEKELAHIRNELIDLKGEYARVMREKEQADGRAREAQQAADQSAKEAKYFKEKSETLQQELYAEQPGQPGQPGQQPRGSTLGGKQTFETQTSRVFDPSGGRGSFIQGTSTQRGSVMIDPAEIEKLRRDLQDVVLENDKLKMDLSQQEKEKDLAKKRQSEAEADTAAQIEKVKYLEKVMAEQQAKLRQAPRPSTVGGSRFVSIDDLNNAQDKLHDSEKELAHIRNELIDLKGEYARVMREKEQADGRAREALLSFEKQSFNLKSELNKSDSILVQKQHIIDDLNNQVSLLNAQLLKQKRMSTLSVKETDILSENIDLKDQVIQLKLDLQESQKATQKFKEELEQANIHLENIKHTYVPKTDVSFSSSAMKLTDHHQDLKDKEEFSSNLDRVKTIIESCYPGEDATVSVILNPANFYIIDIERPGIPKDSKPHFPSDTPSKQRIKIPAQMFDKLKEISIESNTDAFGTVIPQTMLRQSFREGMKVTEVFTSPQSNTVFTSQLIQAEQKVKIDQNTAEFFDLVSPSKPSFDKQNDVSVALVETKLEPTINPKELSLIHTLIAPKISQLENNLEATIKVTSLTEDGQPSSKIITVVDPSGAEVTQSKIKETLINDIVAELNKLKLRDDSQAKRGSQLQKHEGTRPSIFREVPQNELPTGLIQIDQIALSKQDPSESEVVQRIILKDVDMPIHKGKTKDIANAVVQVESLNQEGRISICEYKCTKKADGGFSMTKINQEDQPGSYTRPASLEKIPSESLTRELSALKTLLECNPPAINFTPEAPAKVRLEDGKILIEKISTDGIGLDEGVKRRGTRTSVVGTQIRPKEESRESVILERFIVDPSDMVGRASKFLALKETKDNKDLSQVVVEKLVVDDKGVLQSNVLGKRDKIDLQTTQELINENNIVSAVDQAGLGELGKRELPHFVSMTHNRRMSANPELSQLLPYILPENQASILEKIAVKVKDEGRDKIFEIFQLVQQTTGGDDDDENKAHNKTQPIGLVTQRVRISDFNRAGSKWKIAKEMITPTGTIQKEVFEIPRVPQSEIMKKNIKPALPSNRSSQRTYSDPKSVQTSLGVSKGVDIFELGTLSAEWIKEMKRASVTPGKEVIIQTEHENSVNISKYTIPIESICFCELTEQVHIDTSSQQGVHMYTNKGGESVMEEFQQSPDQAEVQLKGRITIGLNKPSEESSISLMQRSMEPMASDLFSASALLPRDRPSLQTIIKHNILNNETIQMAVPIEPSFDLVIPPSLEECQITVKERQIQEASNILSSQILESVQAKSKAVSVLGGLQNAFSFLPTEVSRDLMKNEFILANFTPEGLVVEKVEVLQGNGSLLDNLKLGGKVIITQPKHSSKMEDSKIMKEIPADKNNVQVLNYKLSNQEGTPLPSTTVKKVLENTTTEHVPIGTPTLVPAGIEKEFLRFLFSTHEFGSQYMMVKNPESSKEWMKVSIPKPGENAALELKETWRIEKLGSGRGVEFERTINEDKNRIEEQVLIAAPTIAPDSSTKRLSISGTAKFKQQGEKAIRNLARLKHRVKLLKGHTAKLKLHENPTGDGLDSLRVNVVPDVLTDLLNLSFQAYPGSSTSYETKPHLNMLQITDEKAILKVVSIEPVGAERLMDYNRLKPQTILRTEIDKTAEIKPFASLLASKLIQDSIIEKTSVLPIEVKRASYLTVNKVAIDPATLTQKEEHYQAIIDVAANTESLVKTKESMDRIDREDIKKESDYLKRYLNFICSLFKIPENIKKPNSIIGQRVQGDKVMITRGDLIKDSKSQDTSSLKMYVREELTIDKDLFDALSMTGSDGLPSTNFTSEDAVKLIEGKIKEYSSSQLPQLVEKLTVRRSSIHEGSVVVDNIKVGVKNGLFTNTVEERKVFEEVAPREPAGVVEKISENLNVVLKAAIKQREEIAETAKTIGLIEEGEKGEISISQLRLVEPQLSNIKDPMSCSLEDFGVSRTRKISFDQSSSKFNFIFHKDEPVQAKSESVVFGNKIQIETIKISSDFGQSMVDSVTVPRLPDWDTQLNLIELEKAFKRAGLNSSKPDCFIQRCTDGDKVVYKIVQVEEVGGETVLKVVEQLEMQLAEDSFSDKIDRPTMKLTESLLYERMSPSRNLKEDKKEAEFTPLQVRRVSKSNAFNITGVPQHHQSVECIRKLAWRLPKSVGRPRR
jgi:DNA repair exonuclease SbcCD ATPase subunit